jgi:hypothetical protein
VRRRPMTRKIAIPSFSLIMMRGLLPSTYSIACSLANDKEAGRGVRTAVPACKKDTSHMYSPLDQRFLNMENDRSVRTSST